MDILRLTRHLSLEIAFPTQTLYLKRGSDVAPVRFDPSYGRTVAAEKNQIREDVRASLTRLSEALFRLPPGASSNGVDGESTENAADTVE